MFERDVLLNELKQGVMEFYFKPEDIPLPIRCTLKPNLLPSSFTNDKDLFENFCVDNPTKIAAWDVMKNKWVVFNINDIEYVQSQDNY